MSTPVIAKARVTTDGLTLTVTFDVPVSISYTPAPGDTTTYTPNPLMNGSFGPLTASYNSGDGTVTLAYNLNRSVYECELVGLQYVDASINNGGDRLEDAIGTIDNDSTVARKKSGGDKELKGDYSNRNFNRIDTERRIWLPRRI